MKFLSGWRTYLVAAVGVIVNGLAASGYIDAATVATINKFLGFIGLAFLRASVK